MIRVNAERLWSTLEIMAQIGGTPAGGVTRLALSNEDRLARDLLRDWAQEAGFRCEIDSMGNMFIRRAGKKPQLAPVMTGSHVDSQPLGGRYDGIYGVLAGLEVLRTLNDQNIETERDIVLVNWTNEEGARFAPAMLASGVWSGQFTQQYAWAREDQDGISVGEALEAIGYRGDQPTVAFPVYTCYELHIEQGPILEEEGIDIGLVDADGLLSVTAMEKSTGVEASIQVKPSYGLTDSEIATMIQDSMSFAEQDVKARMLAEQKVEAARVLESLTGALAADAALLSAAEQIGRAHV